MKAVNKSELNILSTSKNGTLILDTNNFNLFGFDNKPFALNAKQLIDGKTNEICYKVSSTFKGFNGQNITSSEYFFIK